MAYNGTGGHSCRLSTNISIQCNWTEEEAETAEEAMRNLCGIGWVTIWIGNTERIRTWDLLERMGFKHDIQR